MEDACVAALSLARKKNRRVRMRFNGITFVVNKRLSLRHILRQWDERVGVAYRKWRDSREHEEQQAEALRKLINAKRQVATTSDNLRDIVKDRDRLITCLGVLAESCFLCGVDDTPGVDFPFDRWVAELEAAGYVAGEAGTDCGMDKEKMARYLVGQCLDFFKKKSPLPPVVKSFADKYFTIKQDES